MKKLCFSSDLKLLEGYMAFGFRYGEFDLKTHTRWLAHELLSHPPAMSLIDCYCKRGSLKFPEPVFGLKEYDASMLDSFLIVGEPETIRIVLELNQRIHQRRLFNERCLLTVTRLLDGQLYEIFR